MLGSRELETRRRAKGNLDQGSWAVRQLEGRQKGRSHGALLAASLLSLWALRF